MESAQHVQHRFRTALQIALSGLKEATIEEIAGRIVSAVRLDCTSVADDDMTIGSTKLGGRPDLKRSWPLQRDGEPLLFVGQFLMEDVRPFDAEQVLPASGLLSFFCLPGGKVHPDDWHVHLEQDTTHLTRTAPPHDDLWEFETARLGMSQVYQFDSPLNVLHEDHQWSDQVDAIARDVGLDILPGAQSQLLGLPESFRDPLHRIEETARSLFPLDEPRSYRVLLDLPSWDVDLPGDLVSLTFAIPMIDLQAHRFDRVLGDATAD